MTQQNKAYSLSYAYQRIANIDSLSLALVIRKEELIAIASEVDKYYHETTIPKKNGKERQIVWVDSRLKEIQASIKRHILDHVLVPCYLMGGVKGKDFKSNAQQHCESRIIIQEDIKDFYPSITDLHVHNIWKKFFKFDESVSKLLTQLTTFKGVLPQGTSTSVALANLAFFEREGMFFQWCKARQLNYTRYIDDICISSRRKISKKFKSKIIRKLYGMIIGSGFKPQRSKHQSSTSGRRLNIMGQVVNKKNLTLPYEERKKIRATIHNLKAGKKGFLIKQSTEFRSAMGKVNHLGRYHPKEAEKLKEVLLECCRN